MANGNGESTAFNNFANLMIFLRWAGIETGIKKNEWPERPERDPEEYSDEEITGMLKAADAEERLVLKSFLFSGFRSGEIAHLTGGEGRIGRAARSRSGFERTEIGTGTVRTGKTGSPGQPFEVLQVKEKFGELRFYTNYTTDEIRNRIGTARAESLRVCEICGQPGTRREHRWIRTLCDEHDPL